MSSLWTPGGEHRVPRAAPGDAAGDEPGPADAPPAGPGRAGAPGRGLDEEATARAAAEELAAIETELAAMPAADVVANHCYGLFELAAVHLRQRPPRLDQAAVAIDALGAVVERLGERLGATAVQLQEGLSSIRLAYVQLAAAPPGPRPDGTGATEEPRPVTAPDGEGTT